MRRGYGLTDTDIQILIPIMEGIIYRLEMGDIDEIELSIINLGPSQFIKLLEHLDYEMKDDWDTNGWEQDTWIYFTKEGHLDLTLFYCGYDGKIKLFWGEEENE